MRFFQIKFRYLHLIMSYRTSLLDISVDKMNKN